MVGGNERGAVPASFGFCEQGAGAASPPLLVAGLPRSPPTETGGAN
jgi:hypothetical protein